MAVIEKMAKDKFGINLLQFKPGNIKQKFAITQKVVANFCFILQLINKC